MISEKNCRAKIVFAKKHLNWIREQWSKVIFTDESKFNKFESDEKTYVRHCVMRNRKKLYKTNWKLEDQRRWIGIWGAMSMNSIGFIHRIQRIMNRYVYIVKYSKKDTTIICRKMSGK